jgi:hypothetical protein
VRVCGPAVVVRNAHNFTSSVYSGRSGSHDGFLCGETNIMAKKSAKSKPQKSKAKKPTAKKSASKKK